LDGVATQKFHIKEPYIEQPSLFPEKKKDDTESPAEPQDLL